jgi:hypothetical protein
MGRPQKASRDEIPMRYKAAVYYFGLNYHDIEHLDYLDGSGMRIRVKLRKGDLEWSGILTAPPWRLRPPVTRIEDLINNTKDCPACKGSGKVSKE